MYPYAYGGVDVGGSGGGDGGELGGGEGGKKRKAFSLQSTPHTDYSRVQRVKRLPPTYDYIYAYILYSALAPGKRP